MRRLILLVLLLALSACAAHKSMPQEKDGGIGGTGAPDL
jgi:hypothetical protein